METRKIVFSCLVAAWIAIPGAPFSLASDPPAREVLLLNSYHKGLDWTDKITEGIESTLRKAGPPVDIRVEYMDTRHVNDPEHFRMLYESYKHKFANSRFDLIISSDDDAFNFLLKNRDDLFPGTPVVFCGVNYFRDSMLAGRDLFTGVVEAFDVNSTLDTALRIHPDTRRVVVYVDNTVTGVANRKIAAEALAARTNKVEGVFIENLYIEEIREKGFFLPPASIVLMMTFPRDRHGNVSEENLHYVSGKCNVPIYSVWDFFLGRGIVGGMITSGFSQGEAAAKLALRILGGEKAESIPVVKESPNRYMFDTTQMRRFGIKRSDLPEGSVFINAPYSLYRERPEWVWGFATVIAVLASIIGILIANILRRKKAEEALRESEERYRTLVETSSDGIVRFDIDGKILMVNRQCVRMCGYESPGEFPGRNIFEFIAPGDHERASGNIRKLLDAGGTLLEEYTLLRKDGARFQTETSASVIPDSGGKPNGLVVVVRDVTERRGLEKQLFHALKMEAVGRLAGGLAHDINNYLGAITGFSDLVKITHGKDKALAKRMDTIAETALRASSLIRQLLSFSRRQPTVPEVLNLNVVIEGMETMMSRLIGEDVKLATRLTGNPRNVKADPSQVEQILVNLLVNARDAMPHGGEVTIETANVEFDAGESGIPGFMKPGRYLMLAVSDTGTGIPEEIREKIFEPFFTTKETGKGSGLGLSTVYGIVKQHDGYIQVHSRPGKGAAFKTYFPACENRVDSSTASPDLLHCARQGSENVLLAEDNDDVRESTTEILETLGYKVQAASNGEEALLLFEKQRAEIDLLITDVVMPGMGGKMLADRAREMKKNLKVLFISGYPDEVIATHGVLHEGVNYLQKPFSVSGLSGKIREMLD